jgi:putative ABC transport system permease protein
MGILLSILHQGLIFSLVATGVFVTSRVIKRDDLSVEGTFGLGGAVTAWLLALGMHPLLVLVAAVLSGAVLGGVTGLLYTRFYMNYLMAGLVTTTACFSINLSLASANKIVEHHATLFSLTSFLGEQTSQTVWLVFFSVAAIFLAKRFFVTEMGLLMRAAGENPDLLTRLAKPKGRYQTGAFVLANGLTALAGCLFVQWSGFFSITGSVGTLVTGLASLMIAELILPRLLVLTMIAASILYQTVFAVTIAIGVPPVWNNLVKALIIVLLVIISVKMKATNRNRHA